MFHAEVDHFIACPDLYRAYKLYKECIKKIENSDDAFLSEETFAKIQDKIKYPGTFFDPAEKQDFVDYYMYIVHIASLEPKDRKKDLDLMTNATYSLNRVFAKYGYKKLIKIKVMRNTIDLITFIFYFLYKIVFITIILLYFLKNVYYMHEGIEGISTFYSK